MPVQEDELQELLRLQSQLRNRYGNPASETVSTVDTANPISDQALEQAASSKGFEQIAGVPKQIRDIQNDIGLRFQQGVNPKEEGLILRRELERRFPGQKIDTKTLDNRQFFSIGDSNYYAVDPRGLKDLPGELGEQIGRFGVPAAAMALMFTPIGGGAALGSTVSGNIALGGGAALLQNVLKEGSRFDVPQLIKNITAAQKEPLRATGRPEIESFIGDPIVGAGLSAMFGPLALGKQAYDASKLPLSQAGDFLKESARGSSYNPATREAAGSIVEGELTKKINQQFAGKGGESLSKMIQAKIGSLVDKYTKAGRARYDAGSKIALAQLKSGQAPVVDLTDVFETLKSITKEGNEAGTSGDDIVNALTAAVNKSRKEAGIVKEEVSPATSFGNWVEGGKNTVPVRTTVVRKPSFDPITGDVVETYLPTVDELAPPGVPLSGQINQIPTGSSKQFPDVIDPITGIRTPYKAAQKSTKGLYNPSESTLYDLKQIQSQLSDLFENSNPGTTLHVATAEAKNLLNKKIQSLAETGDTAAQQYLKGSSLYQKGYELVPVGVRQKVLGRKSFIDQKWQPVTPNELSGKLTGKQGIGGSDMTAKITEGDAAYIGKALRMNTTDKKNVAENLVAEYLATDPQAKNPILYKNIPEGTLGIASDIVNAGTKEGVDTLTAPTLDDIIKGAKNQKGFKTQSSLSDWLFNRNALTETASPGNVLAEEIKPFNAKGILQQVRSQAAEFNPALSPAETGSPVYRSLLGGDTAPLAEALAPIEQLERAQQFSQGLTKGGSSAGGPNIVKTGGQELVEGLKDIAKDFTGAAVRGTGAGLQTMAPYVSGQIATPAVGLKLLGGLISGTGETFKRPQSDEELEGLLRDLGVTNKKVYGR